jgi:hypothetical protein
MPLLRPLQFPTANRQTNEGPERLAISGCPKSRLYSRLN